MNKWFLMILAFAGPGFTSCRLKHASIQKTWFFNYTVRSDKGGDKDIVLTPADFINLEKDGSFTSYLGNFKYGTYKNSDKVLTLYDADGEIKRIAVVSLDDKELVLDLSPKKQNGHFYLFSGIRNDKLNPSGNPYSVENNRWRIKPATAENDEQLTARLKNYFHYWETYFSWALANEVESLDVRSLKGPILLYSNGFTLESYEDLDSSWTQCFYNEENCHTAWQKVKTFMVNEDIAWPKTDNRFKSFIGAFQQLQERIK